jgi:hypothetical protein
MSEISPQEFVDRGYLQEINRLLLHPLGLAIDFIQPLGTTANFVCRLIDQRIDRSGMTYDEVDAEKAAAICEELLARKTDRMHALHYVIQPIKDRQVLVTNYTDPATPVEDGVPGPIL